MRPVLAKILACRLRLCLFAVTVLLFALNAPAHAQCMSPAGSEGDVIFNTTHKVPQYCDGNNNWIAMIGAERNLGGGGGGSACGEDVCNLSVGAFRDCTGSVLTSASLNLADCETQCLSWIGTHGYQCCEHNSGTCRYKDGSPVLNFTAGHYGAMCTYQELVGTEGSGEYCYYIDENNDGAYKSFCTDQVDEPNKECSTTIIPGFTICIWGSSGFGDACIDFGGGPSCGTYGDSGTTNGHRYFAYQGDGSGDGSGPWCAEGLSGGGDSSMTQIVPDGLVGHWRLDETSGTTASDSSGAGNHGTMQGGLDAGNDSVNGVINGALAIDGSNRWINLGNDPSLEIGLPITVSMWINLNSTEDQYFFSNNRGSNLNNTNFAGVWVTYGSGTLHMNYGDNGGTGPSNRRRKSAAISLEPGTWYQATFVFRGATDMSMYIDGEDIGGTYSGSGGSIAYSAFPGSIGGMEGYFGSTLFDDVRIYNRALSEDEIQEIYQARDGIRYNTNYRVPEFFDGNQWVAMPAAFPEVTNGLVGHWKLDETSGTTAFDSSDTGFDISGPNFTGRSVRSPTGRGINLLTAGNSAFCTSPVPADFFANNAVTLSAWVKLESADSNAAIIEIENFASLQKQHNGNRFLFRTWAWETEGSTLRDEMPIGQWTHVLVAYDYNDPVGTHPSFYVNGNVVSGGWATSPSGAYVPPTPDRICVGKRIFSSTSTFPGSIADARVYNRVLSPDEIQTLFNMGSPIGNNTALLEQGCPDIGDVCADGTIYAGVSPDGNAEMYTTSADEGLYPWNNGNTSGYVTIGVGSANTGMANTLALAALDSDSVTAGIQPHQAAQACADSTAHGYSDWYLPAQSELNELFTYKNTGSLNGTFNETGDIPAGAYWSSSEVSNLSAWRQNFSSGDQSMTTKNAGLAVRCVRKGPVPICENPVGREGDMFYNTGHNVVQYCDGARWIGIGKNE